MIAQLAKLGLTQHITVVLDYTEGGVTATVLLKPKKEGEKAPNPIQVSGTIAEVEAHLSTDFSTDVDKVVGLHTNIAEVTAALEKDKKDAEEKRKADLAAAGKAKDGSNKGGKAKKEKPEPEPEPAEPASKTTKLASSALTPAWKKKPGTPEPTPALVAVPAVDDAELDDLFNEEANK